MTKADDDLDALEEVDRKARLGRTVTQVGIPTAIVGIGTWLASLAHIDLDPGRGSDLPANVTGYFIALVTAGIAWWMNRRPKADPEAGQSDVRGLLTLLVTVLVAAILALVLYRLLNHQATGL